MCDICVMNSVKDRMLGRRDLFRASAATAAVATMAALGARPAMAASHGGGVVDMTHTYDGDRSPMIRLCRKPRGSG